MEQSQQSQVLDSSTPKRRYIVWQRESQSSSYFWSPKEAMRHFRGTAGVVDLLVEGDLVMTKGTL